MRFPAGRVVPFRFLQEPRPEGPLGAPCLHRLVHTAHYSALYGRCGSARERQSRPEGPLGAPGLHCPVHTAHYSALYGRCGSARESFPLACRYFPVELPSTDGSGFCQKRKPNIAFLRTFACNALGHRVLRKDGRFVVMLGWLKNHQNWPFCAILTLHLLRLLYAIHWSIGDYAGMADV